MHEHTVSIGPGRILAMKVGYNEFLLSEAGMAVDHDGGIVNGYVSKFRQLGVKAISGEDVSDQLTTLVEEANGHLDVSKTGDPVENKRRLIGQLKLQAELLAGGSPEQAKLMMEAARLLGSKLPTRLA